MLLDLGCPYFQTTIFKKVVPTLSRFKNVEIVILLFNHESENDTIGTNKHCDSLKHKIHCIIYDINPSHSPFCMEMSKASER